MIFRAPDLLWLIPLLLIAVALIAWRGTLGRVTLLLRALLLALLLAAVADPVRPGTDPPPPLVVLVDGSAGLPAPSRAAAWRTALDVAARHGREETILAIFGRDVVVAPSRPAQQPPAVDGTASDIPGALRLARDLLGGATETAPGRRVLLISDGAATTPGADAVAAELHRAGITVDVLALPPDERFDARVVEIGVPAALREGQSYRGEVVIAAPSAATAILRFSQDDEPPSEQTVRLSPGRTTIPFSGTGGRSGVHRFSAELRIADAHTENNRLERAVVVGPAPRVLVIEREPDSAARLRDIMEQGGVQSEARRPQDLPFRLSDLERFDAIVLQDVPASALSLDQQSALREYVRALGHGLLALGGANSYGLGEYKDTPLEDVLPVDMQPPPRRERQIVSLLLIIDHSASMYGRDPRTSKLEMAKSGAIAATQALVPNDRLGVLVFDTEPHWIVPFTNIGEGRSLSEIQDAITSIQFGGGTDIYRALAAGLPALMAEGGPGTQHAVLLTDGRSYAEDQDYDQLIAVARQQGVTLSTIAIGADADTALLERLADQGSGRYSFAAQPEDLPRLTLQETEIAREDPRVEGELQPRVERAHPTIRGFVPRQLPPLNGYLATTPKPTADVILESPEGDAILAGWQYGLGRALAWTSDIGERWAGSWQTWAESPAFWTQVLAYTFPDPTTGPLQTRLEPRDDGMHVIAEAIDAAGTPLDLADVAVRVDDPAGTEQTLDLKQVAPGRYEARLSIEGDRLPPGAYRLSSALEKDGERLEALAGWSQPYAVEYTGVPADVRLLERVAQAGGGDLLSAAEAPTVLSAPPPRDPRSLWPWLAGLAIILWPLEIAVRRGWLRRSAP